ncbi:MAG: hypothetical protein ABJG86_09505 [Nitratireductor sp.]
MTSRRPPDRAWARLRLTVFFAIAIVLSACAHAPQNASGDAGSGRDNPLAGCCETPERSPAWLVALAEPAAPLIGNVIGRIAWRGGHLAGDDKALRLLGERMRPLDIIVVSSKGRLSGNTLPGLFVHAITYLGTEAELRRLGVWDHPAVRPHQAAIRAGAVFVEADYRGVHLSRPEAVLNTDRLVVLRANRHGKGGRAGEAVRLAGHVGNPFDFNFDGDDPDRLFCTELVGHVMPQLTLSSRQAYGRRIILADEMIADALAGRNGLRVVLYLKGDRQGVLMPTRAALARDIGAAWNGQRPTGRRCAFGR